MTENEQKLEKLVNQKIFAAFVNGAIEVFRLQAEVDLLKAEIIQLKIEKAEAEKENKRK